MFAFCHVLMTNLRHWPMDKLLGRHDLELHRLWPLNKTLSKVYSLQQFYNILQPMTDPWCWYICQHKGGILMVNVTIYSSTMDPMVSMVSSSAFFSLFVFFQDSTGSTGTLPTFSAESLLEGAKSRSSPGTLCAQVLPSWPASLFLLGGWSFCWYGMFGPLLGMWQRWSKTGWIMLDLWFSNWPICPRKKKSSLAPSSVGPPSTGPEATRNSFEHVVQWTAMFNLFNRWPWKIFSFYWASICFLIEFPYVSICFHMFPYAPKISRLQATMDPHRSMSDHPGPACYLVTRRYPSGKNGWMLPPYVCWSMEGWHNPYFCVGQKTEESYAVNLKTQHP